MIGWSYFWANKNIFHYNINTGKNMAPIKTAGLFYIYFSNVYSLSQVFVFEDIITYKIWSVVYNRFELRVRTAVSVAAENVVHIIGPSMVCTNILANRFWLLAQERIIVHQKYNTCFLIRVCN